MEDPDSNAKQWGCIECPAGTFVPAFVPVNSCTKCLPGTYNALPGQQGCAWCEQGYYNPKTGSTSKKDCLVCDAGYICPEKSVKQVPCPLGQSSAAGAGSCVKCPKGFSSAAGGLCVACPSGTSNDQPGGSCRACSKGSYSKTNPILGISSCTACLVGFTTGERTGQTECVAVAAGFQNTGAASVVKRCPDGMVSNQGDSACTACPNGQYALNNKCTRCASGTWNKGFVTRCEPCAKGTYQTFGGCQPCAAGYFNPTEGLGDSCYICPKNSFSSASASLKCTTCREFDKNKPYTGIAGSASSSACTRG